MPRSPTRKRGIRCGPFEILVTPKKSGMKRYAFLLAALCTASTILAQQAGIPEWFTREMERDIGSWVTDNAAYHSENEPMDHYVVDYYWDNYRVSIRGELYGLIDGKKTRNFWEFHKYWDFKTQAPILFQIAADGSTGAGPFQYNEDHSENSLVQDFAWSDGSVVKMGHKTIVFDEISHVDSTYTIGEDGVWAFNRTYRWDKQPAAKRIKSTIDSTSATELVLIQEFEVNVPVDSVWHAYTTGEGMESWAVPLAEVDLKVGGLIKTNYNQDGQLGDSTTIVTHIVNYVPKQVLTLQAEMTHNFPQFMRDEEKDFYNVIFFQKLGKNRTKVVSYGIGYKKTPKFLSLMEYFISANEAALEKLIGYLEAIR